MLNILPLILVGFALLMWVVVGVIFVAHIGRSQKAAQEDTVREKGPRPQKIAA